VETKDVKFIWLQECETQTNVRFTNRLTFQLLKLRFILNIVGVYLTSYNLQGIEKKAIFCTYPFLNLKIKVIRISSIAKNIIITLIYTIVQYKLIKNLFCRTHFYDIRKSQNRKRESEFRWRAERIRGSAIRFRSFGRLGQSDQRRSGGIGKLGRLHGRSSRGCETVIE